MKGNNREFFFFWFTLQMAATAGAMPCQNQLREASCSFPACLVRTQGLMQFLVVLEGAEFEVAIAHRKCLSCLMSEARQG